MDDPEERPDYGTEITYTQMRVRVTPRCEEDALKGKRAAAVH